MDINEILHLFNVSWTEMRAVVSTFIGSADGLVNVGSIPTTTMSLFKLRLKKYKWRNFE